jgi:hypothetical protein
MNRVEMGEPGWMLQELSKEFTRQGIRIADQLRRAADDVERAARHVPKDLTTGLPDHNASASNVLKAIDTMHGNFSTTALLKAAADADRHARNPEEGS